MLKIFGLQKRGICTQMAFQERNLGPENCLGEAYAAWTKPYRNHSNQFSYHDSRSGLTDECRGPISLLLLPVSLFMWVFYDCYCLMGLQGKQKDCRRGSPGTGLSGSDKITPAWVKLGHIPAPICQHVGETVLPKREAETSSMKEAGR